MLNVTEKILEDTSVYSVDYFPFNPIQGTQYNSPGIIQIDILNQDEYYLPHLSWLQFDIKLTKLNGDAYAAQDVTLGNNGLMYLFQNIKYLLGGNEMEGVNHPGQATTMMGILKYEKDFPGLSMCWTLDTNDSIANNAGFVKRKGYIFALENDDKGIASFGVDMEHFSGFAEDYDKVVFGQRQSLVFNRKANDDEAIFRLDDEINGGKVDIKKITWWMARVKPSVAEATRLASLNLRGDVAMPLGFRRRECAKISLSVGTINYTWSLGVKTETPRYVIIALQTTKSLQKQNSSLFDHCKVTNMKVRVNSTEYPSIDVNSDFTANNYAGWYRRFIDFKRSFYGVDKMISATAIDIKDFKDLYPIYVFDLKYQHETYGNSTVLDISVNASFGGTGTAAGTEMFALVISDRKLKIEVGGKRTMVIY